MIFFKAVSNLGLVIFMFLLGLEMDQQTLKKNITKYVVSGLMGVGLPFVASIPVSVLLYNLGGGWIVEGQPFYVFMLFMGIGISKELKTVRN